MNEAMTATHKARFSGHANLLWRVAGELATPMTCERSCKLSHGTLLGHRFLLGIAKSAVDGAAEERILAACARLGMPAYLLEQMGRRIGGANYLHFGFEENTRTCLYKIYLEFWDAVARKLVPPRTATGPLLLHLGYKWDAGDPSRCAVSRYDWYPWLSVPEITDRLTRLCGPSGGGEVLATAAAFVLRAAERVSPRDILYLEVAEDGNPRRSFDINIYRADLQAAEVYPYLCRMGRYFRVPVREFHRLYEHMKTAKFGHLSGGVDREGKEFFTFYYGVEDIDGGDARTHGTPVEAPPAGGPVRRAAQPGRCLPGVEETDGRATALFRLVKDLGAPVAVERSFKLRAGTILPDRFLLGVQRSVLGPGGDERICAICRRLGMPGDFLAEFTRGLSAANIVLFGFECGEGESRYKAYLEFSDRIAAAGAACPDRPAPCLVHEGFKWAAGGTGAKTRYTCFPALSGEEMERRMARLLPGAAYGPIRETARGFLETAAVRADCREFLYFEAEEDGNPRLSFDINLYRANLRMEELYPLFMEMLRYFAVPPEPFRGYYEAAREEIFGHLTGGIDRRGRTFLTVYHSEKGSSRPPASGSGIPRAAPGRAGGGREEGR